MLDQLTAGIAILLFVDRIARWLYARETEDTSLKTNLADLEKRLRKRPLRRELADMKRDLAKYRTALDGLEARVEFLEQLRHR